MVTNHNTNKKVLSHLSGLEITIIDKKEYTERGKKPSSEDFPYGVGNSWSLNYKRWSHLSITRSGPPCYNHIKGKSYDSPFTCLRYPAPNARVTLRRPFTLSLTIQWLSSGCSFFILRTSCRAKIHETKIYHALARIKTGNIYNSVFSFSIRARHSHECRILI